MNVIKATPKLSNSQLNTRIGLAKNRLSQYPLNKLDFIMMDLERPTQSHRHADWCAGDLTGRILEFTSCAENIDSENYPCIKELFERIIRTSRKSGLIGNLAPDFRDNVLPEDRLDSGCHRLFNGLVKYYEYSNDYRALEAAIKLGDYYVNHKEDWIKAHKDCKLPGIDMWITEPLAGLYKYTNDSKYLDMIKTIVSPIKEFENCHTHGFLTTLRGMQLAYLYSNDPFFNELPEKVRKIISNEYYEMADGCMPETFTQTRNGRNEGCSIADWLMLNLNAAMINDDSKLYEKAEHILWNALFFNQFINGSFGHRDLMEYGYKMGPISECWWCCCENAGMAMTEYARHAVTLKDNTLNINLLVSGEFTIDKIKVTISTNYPNKVDTIIKIANLPENYKVNIRIPSCIKNADLQQRKINKEIIYNLTGLIGHTLENYKDKVMLKYGPIVLAPMIYYWDSIQMEHGNVPSGYIPSNLPPGLPKLNIEKYDENGFCKLVEEPIPEWSYFEVGPDAPLAINDASCYVDMIFDNGQKETRYFTPLCHITSNMTYMETPIIFNK